jgi:hypothetical protein
MLKPFNQYSLEMRASVQQGIAGQILCYEGARFAGRIDFYTGEPLPTSYLWHPTGTGDPNSIYIVLAMPMTSFGAVAEILRTEEPFGLELWPSGPMSGAATDGYGGVVRSLNRERVGEDERSFVLTPRPRVSD